METPPPAVTTVSRITAGERRFLLTVHEAGGAVRTHVLAELLGIGRSQVCAHGSRLVAAGLIERHNVRTLAYWGPVTAKGKLEILAPARRKLLSLHTTIPALSRERTRLRLLAVLTQHDRPISLEAIAKSARGFNFALIERYMRQCMSEGMVRSHGATGWTATPEGRMYYEKHKHEIASILH